MTTILFQISNMHVANVIQRPSKSIKSPYVSDVIMNEEQLLAHSPSLGCCGLADKGAEVLVEKTSTSKCDAKIQLSVFKEPNKSNTQIIGIHPKLSETLVHQALLKDCFTLLTIEKVEREKKMKNSRFDFMGIDRSGKQFILEVKAVPLADYDYVNINYNKKRNSDSDNDYAHLEYNEKISYFPDGYRKKKTDTVSPRALKHIQELEQIKMENPEIRCILCFVIQRTDVKHFEPSKLDSIYKEAVQKAYINGVEIFTLQVHWKYDAHSQVAEAHHYSSCLPIQLFDECGPFMRL